MEKSFESSLSELEKIVAQLEAGDLPLEQSLELFEKGIKLSRECRERLSKAEQKIEELVRNGKGELDTRDLDPQNLRD
jgi:exodeoxyribonuclease VII small subunit